MFTKRRSSGAICFLAIPAYQASAKKKAKSKVMLATTTFPTSTGLPLSIPDNNTTGVNLSVPVSGLTDQLRGIAVNLTITHSWVGDLRATLGAPPANSPTHRIFYEVGNSSGTSAGDSSDIGGTYVFTDGTLGDFWAAAAAVPNGTIISPGSYRTTGALSGAATDMNPVFAGPVLYDPQQVSNQKMASPPTDNIANGTWNVNIVDRTGGDIGAVQGLSLTITTLAPTAALVSVRGTVKNSAGQGVARARVTIYNTQTGEALTATTNPFGNYRFDGLPVGQFYTMFVEHKEYQFEIQSFTLEDDRQANFESYR